MNGKLRHDETRGLLPPGWKCGVTGKGTPRWLVQADPTAPSAPQVLQQIGAGTFPWCVKADVAPADGYVEVKFKPLRGREDQAGGVVWRWKDGDNYYVARANALENNVSLYYTENGRRNTLKYVKARCPPAYGIRCASNFPALASRWRSMARLISNSTTRTSKAPARSGSGPRPTA